VYEATPYDIGMIPNPAKRAEAVLARRAAFAGS
jgi:hypothetical protein